MKFKTEELQNHFDNILNTFTGADGGFKFIMLQRTLNSLEESMLAGNGKADQVLSLVRRFSNLITAIAEDAEKQLVTSKEKGV